MRTFAIVCLAIAAVVADSDPEAYTPLQVALGQTKGGVITGVDYGHGSGLVPAVGVAAVATHHAFPVAAAHAVPVVAAHAAPAVVSSYAAPAVVSSYSAIPYTGYTGVAGLGYIGYSRLAGLGYTGYTGLAGLGYNRHYLGKREADSEADAYTIGQVAHGLTQGGVVTGVDYGHGSGLVPAVGVATHHAVPVVAAHAAPAVVSSYSALPYTGYARHAGLGYTGYSGLAGLGYTGYTGLAGLGYNRHYLGKREADSEADAYTIGQVAHGLTNGGVVTGVSGLPYTGYTRLAGLGYTGYAGHAGLGYTGYSGLAGLGYTGYSGLAGLGYNRHYLGKREADSEADAYTIGQVAHGLPYANAVAAGNAHNPGYITGTNVPVATYAHGIPATTYAHGIAATIPTTYSTLPYATGYAGHLGYGYGLRSLGWNY